MKILLILFLFSSISTLIIQDKSKTYLKSKKNFIKPDRNLFLKNLNSLTKKNNSLFRELSKIKSHLKKSQKKRILNDRIRIISNIIKSKQKTKKFQKKSRKLLIKRFKKMMGKLAYNDWLLKMRNSGVHIKKMPLKQLAYLFNTTQNLIKNEKERKLIVMITAHEDYDINKMTGGKLAVRFPNLPQAIVVNQTPYYSYSHQNQE